MSKKNSRRDFLKKSAIVGAGVAAASCTTSPKNKKAAKLLPGRKPAYEEEKFDYVVVGAGAAGSIIATRLAQQGKTVCLLEAGDDYSQNVKAMLPAIHSWSSEDPKTSWEFFVRHYEKGKEPGQDQKFTRSPGPNAPEGIFYPRAAALGGCTSHNAMITMLPDNKVWKEIQEIAKSHDGADPSLWEPEKMFELFHKNTKDIKPRAIDFSGRPETVSDVERTWLDTDQYPFATSLKSELKRRILYSLITEDQSEQTAEMRAKISAAQNDPVRLDQVKKEMLDEFEEKQREGSVDTNYDYFQKARAKGGKFSHAVPVTQSTNAQGLRSGPRDMLVDFYNSSENQGSAGQGRLLVIEKNALVSKIIRNGHTAVGVEFVSAKALYEADPRTADYIPQSGIYDPKKPQLRPKQIWKKNDEKYRVDRKKTWQSLEQNGTSNEYLVKGLEGDEAVTPVKKQVSVKEGGEVILCGGAFNSPQVLMLSGIGPKEELDKLGDKIQAPKVVLDKVGKNLQDRYEIGVIADVTGIDKSYAEAVCKPQFGGLIEYDPSIKPVERAFSQVTSANDSCWDRIKAQYGSNGVVGGLVKKSSKSDVPDLFIFAIPAKFEGYYPKYSTETRPRWGKSYLTWAILKGHTKNNAGTVKLNDLEPANPLRRPEINFNHFADPKGAKHDLAAIKEAVDIVDRMNEIIGGKKLPRLMPKENESVEQFTRVNAWGHHASCSCPMGKTAKDGVVNANFEVFGVDGLRVVDASVFPNIPGLFIVTPIFMMAERAAEIIMRK